MIKLARILMVFIVLSAIMAGGTPVRADIVNREFAVELLHEGKFPDYSELADDHEPALLSIANALYNYEDVIKMEPYAFRCDEALELYEASVNRHPDLFYVKGTVSVVEENGIITELHPQYEDEDNVSLLAASEYDLEIERILSAAHKTMNDVEKALAVHEYFITHYEYDMGYKSNGNDPYTIRGLFTNKKGVCQAYADGYTYIMNRLGISCVTVSSNSMDHAWNMLQIGGQWYHVDTTWDDPVPDNFGGALHGYFLLSDSAISDSEHGHYGWSSNKVANSFLYDDYFWTKVYGPMVYYDKEWYYAGNSGNIFRHNLQNEVKSNITIEGIDGNRIAVYNDFLFYTGSVYDMTENRYKTYIYQKALSGDAFASVVFTNPSGGYFNGMRIVENVLAYSVVDRKYWEIGAYIYERAQGYDFNKKSADEMYSYRYVHTLDLTTLKHPQNFEMKVASHTLTKAGGTISGNVKIEIQNNTKSSRTAKVILTICDDKNKLFLLKTINDAALSMGNTPFSFNDIRISNAASGKYRVKVMCWGSGNTLTPIALTQTFEVK